MPPTKVQKEKDSKLQFVSKSNKERKSLTISEKMQVLKRLGEGQRNKDICQAMHLSPSTVRTIFLNKEKIQKTAESVVGSSKLTTVSKSRHPLFEKLEQLLTHWIDSHNQRKMPLSFMIIQAKAISLFEDLKTKASDDGDDGVKELEFKGSHGWFERFKKRAHLHSLKVTGEAASADAEAASVFPAQLQNIIDEGGYSSKQIFNVDETGLFWKRMPSRTFISQDEKTAPGHKAAKDRLTLLLGGNLEGDVKLKPLLVYHSLKPRALKGLNMNSLPVTWQANKKAWVTKQVFADYVSSYLSPFIKKYSLENNLSNKALLLLDNAPGHPTSVVEYGDNIQVVFLPPNTTSLIQPMDQGLIATFKAYYLQLVMKYLVNSLDNNEDITIKQLWKNYNIKMAIENIGTAWDKITQKTMNAVWRKLLPNYVKDFSSNAVIQKDIHNSIVELAEKAGFEGVDSEDVKELLNSHEEELTNEELIQLDEKLNSEGEQEEEMPSKTLDTKILQNFFSTIEAATAYLDENDPNLERSRQCKNAIAAATQCYREIYERKKKRSKTDFYSVVFSIIPISGTTAFHIRSGGCNGDNCQQYSPIIK